MELIDYLKLARDLTGSTDIQDLMKSARYLQAEMSEKSAPLPMPTSSWINVNNVVQFIPNLKIQHPIKGAVQFKTFPFQESMASAIEASDKRIVLVNAARQMGSTITLTAVALYRAVTRPNHTVLILANKFVQALEVMDRLRLMVETSELPLPYATEFNKASITFNNGSKIIARALSENASRGLSVDTIMVHDAAYISWGKEAEWWASIQPQLNAGAQVILLSCPYKTKGLFYELWQKDPALAGILKLKYIWSDHPDRDEQWAKYYREQLGDAVFRKEYNGEFLEDEVDADKDQTDSA